ncbi:MAG: hypothetical protein ACFFA3_21380, partial [Promethearchaeota archaeon]
IFPQSLWELTPEGENRFPYFLTFNKVKLALLKLIAQDKELTISRMIKKLEERFSNPVQMSSVEQYLREFQDRDLVIEKKAKQTIYRYNLANPYAKSLKENILLSLDKIHENVSLFETGKIKGQLIIWSGTHDPYFEDILEIAIKCNCAKVYSYSGALFFNEQGMVVGSRSIGEAKSVILSSCLSKMNEPTDDGFICHLWEKTFPKKLVVNYLLEDITENTERGFDLNEEVSLESNLRQNLKTYRKYGDDMLEQWEVLENEFLAESIADLPYSDAELADLDEEINKEEFTKPIELILEEQEDESEVKKKN